MLHEYGPAKNLKYEDFPDPPQPGPGEILVHVSAISINPVDYKMRSGEAKAHFPLEFPAILGRDVAGTVRTLGEGVKGFAEGDRVFALTQHTYAELCVVKAAELAHVPEGLELTTASAVPLVACTGDQLIRQAVAAKPGQTIVLSGAVGSVGRCALFAALEIGVKVIAAVRIKQRDEALALGAIETIDVTNADDFDSLGFVDAVADTVGGSMATRLLSRVKPGGRFGSLLGPPPNAALHPTIDIQAMMAHPDPATLVHYGEAIRDGKLKLPIDRMVPLADAAEAQAAAEKGGLGKIILVP